ncbi:hypothetical protein FB563_3582 [Streptomyces puniciscabiei]|uniref:Uncharacterized protein n=1 Tax=Streptomyces puniciscabiei TaxID=164348 RepID=A0A542UHI4_9ACTN|nr:hypothetical protein [Streptomyces puniciscabiei]TQK98550.1 hypothetical protein FB563_3582 [Streptomyces puniciscabiei]
MTRLSSFQRLALLAASTTVITGGVLSHGSAFAAPQWQKITDSSGITVRLPGKPRVVKYSEGGVHSRDYVVKTGYGALGFIVLDGPGKAPDRPWDLRTDLKAAVDGYNSSDTGAHLRSTEVHQGTTDGDHYLEAKLAGADRVGHIRLVDHGKQALTIMTVGHGDQRQAVDRDYRQVLDSIRAPGHGTRHAEEAPVSA